MKTEISAVLITRDAGKTIERCIKSLQGFDEVLVLDTGSTDNTVLLCQKAGARVVTMPREDPFHFANARNLAMGHAKHQWIFTIDADEVLRAGSIGAIRKVLSGGIAEQDGYGGIHMNYPPDGKSDPMPTRRLMLFKKGKWTWCHRVHERLIPKKKGRCIMEPVDAICVEHRPMGEREGRRVQNVELLELTVKEEPDHLFAFLQLGIEYIHREEWLKALSPLEKYVNADHCEGVFGRSAARMFYGKALFRYKNFQEGMNQFVMASDDAPGRREPPYWAALELIRAGLLPDALHWFERVQGIKPSDEPSFSLYSSDLQGTLVQDTISECKRMMEGAKAPQ